MNRRVARLALLPAALLVCSPLYAQANPGGPPLPVPDVAKPLWQADQDYYVNNIAARVESPTSADKQIGADGKAKSSKATKSTTQAKGMKTGFPPAAQELNKRETLASKKGVSPRTTASKAGQQNVQVGKLLTLLVEFNPNANDDFSGWVRPNTDPTNPADCITEPAGTLLNGPLHNELPDPATLGRGTDNNTVWIPDFTPSYYKKLIYSKTGVTQKLRPDLNGGISIKGKTVRNYYTEVSKGRYLIRGDVSPWLRLPHSEAFYSADTCEAGTASDIGHPDNPLGTGQMAIDAVKALAAANPSFPWADFDQEDQGDADDDGDLYEPDGALDHVVLLHAGAGQEGGGGAEGTYAEWSSSNVVGAATGGVEIPEAGGIRVFNYTTQPEDAGIGVIAHEYGHDLGLPDLYDSVGQPATDSDVGFWDIMSSGSNTGKLVGIEPTHMGAWDKYVLGWLEPEVLEYGSKKAKQVLGQAARPGKKTEAAVRVNLPDKRVQVGEPHSGEVAWWSSNDQSWADVKLSRTVEVPTGTDVRFWSWNEYLIEELWDYGFIEVSTDGGASWEQLEVFDEDGTLVSTDDDPNGNLVTYGGLENGLTGDSGGYRHDYVNLTPYAGDTIQLRLRYATDAAFEERGWFADDFSITVNGDLDNPVWSDDAENGPNGWTAEQGTFTTTTGAGWVQTSGTFDYEQYYLLEWRTFAGFDKGLKTGYVTDWLVGDEWKVRRTPYNAPGLLIWYRDSANSLNDVGNNLFDPPSVGAKGTLLLVDAHFDPARLRGAAAAANPSLLDNLSARTQANDIAFGKVGRRPFTVCVQDGSDDPYSVICNRFGKRKAIKRFTDAKTWYPGIENRPDLDPEAPLFFRDVDASTVVPSKDNEIYSTRIVDRDGVRLPALYGTDLGGGHVLGTGNPADGRPAIEGGDPGTEADLSLGVKVRVVKVGKGNKKVTIEVKPGHKASKPPTLTKTGTR